MAIKKLADVREVVIQRPKRAKLSPEEVRRRMETFEQERKEKFIAAVRESKN